MTNAIDRILYSLILLALLSVGCTNATTDEDGASGTTNKGEIEISLSATIDAREMPHPKHVFADGDSIGIYAINYNGTTYSLFEVIRPIINEWTLDGFEIPRIYIDNDISY